MTARRCSICGCEYKDTFCFKSGFVCENCLTYLREDYSPGEKD